jgi:1-acyl-sn-glycerol-3-phosphate acyltransferase
VIGHARALFRIGLIAVATLSFYVARLTCLPLAPVAPRAFGRAHLALMRTWARTTLSIMGVRLAVTGRPPAPPFLLVANHLSYVDILVLLATVRGTLLSKAEIAHWPVLGFLARTTGTLFVDRTKKRDLPRVIAEIERCSARGVGVAMFPEGTSSDGSGVLPFKPSLFEVAVRTRTPVHCATLGYALAPDLPPARTAICWWGDMTFADHVWRMLHLPRIDARVAFAAEPVPVDEKTDRKDLARAAHDAVEAGFVPVGTSGS